MNLFLFTEQINRLLQTDADPLEGVCDLLRVHTGAGVRLKGRDGRVAVECLAENPGENTEHFSTGELTLSREKPAFTEDEKLAANIALVACTILMRHRDEISAAQKKRRAKAVRAIINSLSFSELSAATHIIKELANCERPNVRLGESHGPEEGLLIAGQIADKLGFARSVITCALRKLEGANLIETRSLGVKGTYIRVKDPLLSEELSKL